VCHHDMKLINNEPRVNIDVVAVMHNTFVLLLCLRSISRVSFALVVLGHAVKPK